MEDTVAFSQPENVLCVNRDGHRIKIIDFGLARKYDPKNKSKFLFGTPEFVAPEVISFERVGYGTDMWYAHQLRKMSDFLSNVSS